MPIRPIDAGTLGLISGLARTVLAVATLGLISQDGEEEPSRVFAFPRIEVDSEEEKKISVMDICMWAVGGGVIR